MEGSVETVFKGSADRLRRRVCIAELTADGYFAKEREKIFRSSWLMVGHESDLPDYGNYVVREVPTLNASLLIVRGADTKLRAFHNICTHRGNKLAQESGGCTKFFSCRFHGWAFSTEGDLEVVTDEHQFRDLDKSILGLKPVAMALWGGRIFVNLDEEPRQSLVEWLGPMHDQYDGYFEQHERLVTREMEVNCNWNVTINAFMEGYHTLYVHAASVPDYQGGPSNPERHRPYIEMFERHQRYSAPGNPHHKVTQAEEVAWRYGRQQLPAFDGDMTGMPPGINPSRADIWAFDVVQLFPNTLMICGNHWHIEMTFWPIDADNTRVVVGNYVYPAQDLGQRLSQDFVLSRGRFIMREDLGTLEAQHAALKSGALTHIQLSQQEIALQHHYRVLEDMLGEA